METKHDFSNVQWIKNEQVLNFTEEMQLEMLDTIGESLKDAGCGQDPDNEIGVTIENTINILQAIQYGIKYDIIPEFYRRGYEAANRRGQAAGLKPREPLPQTDTPDYINESVALMDNMEEAAHSILNACGHFGRRMHNYKACDSFLLSDLMETFKEHENRITEACTRASEALAAELNAF